MLSDKTIGFGIVLYALVAFFFLVLFFQPKETVCYEATVLQKTFDGQDGGTFAVVVLLDGQAHLIYPDATTFYQVPADGEIVTVCSEIEQWLLPTLDLTIVPGVVPAP